MKNPFHNTKASYYDDSEILKFWVSPGPSESIFFDRVMEPNESMPIMILGGKGSGKTHILRYFSFSSQILRAHKKNRTILEQVRHDGYVGIYIVSSGLLASRFSGGNVDNTTWNSIFFYYMNLEFIERFLHTFSVILEHQDHQIDINKQALSDHINFDVNSDKFSNIHDLYKYIKSKRTEIDSQLAALRIPGKTKSLEITPIINQIENGFYAIIENILESIEIISNIKVLFILDEYENFNCDQQRYFNTLFRQPSDLKKRVSFRISGRLWSVKTWKTYDADEILQVDSEIKLIHLEKILKSKYSVFASKLYHKRIKNSQDIGPTNINFHELFSDSKDCDKAQLKDITCKHEHRKHFSRLEKKIDDRDLFEQIKTTLSCGNYLLEKFNILLLYKKWDKKDIAAESLKIKKSCEEFLKGKKNRYWNQFDKYKTYALFQLFRDYGRRPSYSGYKKILQLSENNPRIFLSILSNIFKESIYQDINIFQADEIPCEIQDKAILESSKWFWNNFTEDIKDEKVEWAIIKICELFRAIYRSDNPTEKDLVMFSYNEINISKEALRVIELAVHHSLLIDKGSRVDKNTGELLKLFRLHPMLSPRWGLSASGGGSFYFKPDEISALFLKDTMKWKSIETNILKRHEIRNIVSPLQGQLNLKN